MDDTVTTEGLVGSGGVAERLFSHGHGNVAISIDERGGREARHSVRGAV